MRFTQILQILAFAAATAFTLPAAAMTFTTTNAPASCQVRECVLATGEIERDSGKQLAQFLRENQVPAGATVVLQSEGGNLLGGLALGSAIRAAKLATDVEMFDARSGEFRAGGLCASACAYAFVGGVHRSVGKGCKLGVHQLAGPPNQPWDLSVSDSQWLMSLVATHLDRMGVDMGVMVLALRTSPQDMHWLSPVELARYSVTNSAAA